MALTWKQYRYPGAAFRVVDDRLQYAPTAASRSRGESVDLSASGVEPGKRRVARPNCRFALAMQKDSTGLWRILVSCPGTEPFVLDTRYGAGLAGLPFSYGASPPTPAPGQGTVKP